MADEDDFFDRLTNESTGDVDKCTIEYKEQQFSNEIIDEAAYMSYCGDIRDWPVYHNMFDKKEINKENVVAFFKSFGGRFYRSVYVREGVFRDRICVLIEGEEEEEDF